MLIIRLSRIGKRKMPQYRIVLQDKRHDPWSPAIEVLGNYNPQTDPATVTLKTERIEYWLSQGAQASNTMQNILINAGLMKGKKAKVVTISKKRAEKMTAKKAEAEAKAAEAEIKAQEAKKAAEAAAAAPAPATETPAAPAAS